MNFVHKLHPPVWWGRGVGGGIQKMTLADREGGGGLRRTQKDYVIYDQPLTYEQTRERGTPSAPAEIFIFYLSYRFCSHFPSFCHFYFAWSCNIHWVLKAECSDYYKVCGEVMRDPDATIKHNTLCYGNFECKFMQYTQTFHNLKRFPLAPMGVLTPHLRTLKGVACPPINRNRCFRQRERGERGLTYQWVVLKPGLSCAKLRPRKTSHLHLMSSTIKLRNDALLPSSAPILA